MKKFLLFLSLLAVTLFTPLMAIAADASASATVDVAAILGGLIDKAPSKLITALTIFGTLSAIYQSAIGAWHARVAATTDLDDDAFTAKLESSWWFKVLDRIFYFGGYIGTFIGSKGKKTL